MIVFSLWEGHIRVRETIVIFMCSVKFWDRSAYWGVQCTIKYRFFFFFCEVCIINYHVQIIRSGASVRLETEPSFPVMLINFQVFQAYNGCWIDHLWSHQVYQVSTQVVIKSLISAVLLVLFMALWKIRKRLAFSSILFFSLFMPLVSSVWCFFMF